MSLKEFVDSDILSFVVAGGEKNAKCEMRGGGVTVTK